MLLKVIEPLCLHRDKVCIEINGSLKNCYDNVNSHKMKILVISVAILFNFNIFEYLSALLP